MGGGGGEPPRRPWKRGGSTPSDKISTRSTTKRMKECKCSSLLSVILLLLQVVPAGYGPIVENGTFRIGRLSAGSSNIRPTEEDGFQLEEAANLIGAMVDSPTDRVSILQEKEIKEERVSPMPPAYPVALDQGRVYCTCGARMFPSRIKSERMTPVPQEQDDDFPFLSQRRRQDSSPTPSEASTVLLYIHREDNQTRPNSPDSIADSLQSIPLTPILPVLVDDGMDMVNDNNASLRDWILAHNWQEDEDDE